MCRAQPDQVSLGPRCASSMHNANLSAPLANLIGDGWTLLIMREACLGTRRFEEFQRTLGTGRNILTERLNTLVDEGVLMRFRYQDRPVRHEYRLTDKGRDV